MDTPVCYIKSKEESMKKRTIYSPEFQAEAVRLVLDQGLPISEAVRPIDIPKGTLLQAG